MNWAVNHVHKFIEARESGDDNWFNVATIGLTTIFCYQDDCYAMPPHPSLNREMYPPEKIGPKLYLKAQR